MKRILSEWPECLGAMVGAMIMAGFFSQSPAQMIYWGSVLCCSLIVVFGIIVGEIISSHKR